MDESSVSLLSRRLFSDLDESDYRILVLLARFGMLNEAQIGIFTSEKYAISFDRWGVKRRMNGTIHYVGLLPNDFVYALKINKKETRYGLTLKGILAVLARVKFEKIHAVQKYRKDLEKINKNQTMLKLALECIMAEIRLILYHNYINGFEWTRLKILRAYWHEFKQYDENVIQKFFTNRQGKDTKIETDYNMIKNDYLTKYFLLDRCTHPTDFNPVRLDDSEPSDVDIEFRERVDRWYLIIDRYAHEKRKKDSMINMDWERADLLQYYDHELWIEEKREAEKNAHIEFQKLKRHIGKP